MRSPVGPNMGTYMRPDVRPNVRPATTSVMSLAAPAVRILHTEGTPVHVRTAPRMTRVLLTEGARIHSWLAPRVTRILLAEGTRINSRRAPRVTRVLLAERTRVRYRWLAAAPVTRIFLTERSLVAMGVQRIALAEVVDNRRLGRRWRWRNRLGDRTHRPRTRQIDHDYHMVPEPVDVHDPARHEMNRPWIELHDNVHIRACEDRR